MGAPNDASDPKPRASEAARVPDHASVFGDDGALADALAREAELSEGERKAKLLSAAGEAAERSGDEVSAARHYLGAFNADPAFREPLEGLVRLLYRRRSTKNLGKLLDALVRAASTPAERVRALTQRAAFLEDHAGQPDEALSLLRDATAVDAPELDASEAWMFLELAAARASDDELRHEALAARAARRGDPAWQAHLQADVARGLAERGDAMGALEWFAKARSQEGPATFGVSRGAEWAIAVGPLADSLDEQDRARALADTIDVQIGAIMEAIAEPDRAAALGVPSWARPVEHAVALVLRSASLRLQAGNPEAAMSILVEHAQVIEPFSDAYRIAQTLGVRAAVRRGDLESAADLATRTLAGAGPSQAAALWLTVAERAAELGDRESELRALTQAVEVAPSSIPARALWIDLLAGGGDPSALASAYETLAETGTSEREQLSAWLLAAHAWAFGVGDSTGAKSALAQAGLVGAEPDMLARLGRLLATACNDVPWFEESSRRLIITTSDEHERAATAFELVRAQALREAADLNTTRELLQKQKVLGRLVAWIRARTKSGATDLASLAALERDPAVRTGMAIAAAQDGAINGRWEDIANQLEALKDDLPPHVGTAIVLADAYRQLGRLSESADVLSHAALDTDDGELAVALFLEAGLEYWAADNRGRAIACLRSAAEHGDESATALVQWAERGTSPEDLPERDGPPAELDLDDGPALVDGWVRAIESGAPGEADRILDALRAHADPEFTLAAAIAGLFDERADRAALAADAAIDQVGSDDPDAQRLVAIERLARAHESSDANATIDAARHAFELGVGAPAALVWLSGAIQHDSLEHEEDARLALARALGGQDAAGLLASAASLKMLRASSYLPPSETATVPLLSDPGSASRLTNLDLSPPGCDPRRRATALSGLGDTMGASARIDALAAAGWSFLVSGKPAQARDAFSAAVEHYPEDIVALEGLRQAALQTGDAEALAIAAGRLADKRKKPADRAHMYEEAGLALLELGDKTGAEEALSEAFSLDPTRSVAFDKLFRLVRDARNAPRLLELVDKRTPLSEDPEELAKLFWEKARVLRERGHTDAAIDALRSVTMLEPDHVGALALTGEVNIRAGRLDEAVDALSRLAALDHAPAKNRVTAGVTAVDLLENKLDDYDRAFEILRMLDLAGLSTQPIRERLARAAARVGAWDDAVRVLEVLMDEREDAAGRVEAARLAFAIHRDRREDLPSALAAASRIVQEAPADKEAIEALVRLAPSHPEAGALLQQSRQTLVAELDTNPLDGPTLARIATISRAMGDARLERAAHSAAHALGAGDAASELVLRQASRAPVAMPRVALPPEVAYHLAAPGDEGPIVELFRIMGPTIAHALGPDLEGLKVNKRDRVDARTGFALHREIASWMGALGSGAFELYVGGPDPRGIAGVPGPTPALVVGSEVVAPLTAEQRARVARAAFALTRGTTILLHRDDTTAASIVIACCEIAETPIAAPEYAVLAEVRKLLGRMTKRAQKKALAPVCAQIAQSVRDPIEWSLRALCTLTRAGFLACDDVSIALQVALGGRLDLRTADGIAREKAADLIRFAMSPTYRDIRRSLGLEEGQ